MAKQENRAEKPQVPVAGKRKPYRTPQLTEYGGIAKLTQTTGSTLTESGVPFAKKSCL